MFASGVATCSACGEEVPIAQLEDNKRLYRGIILLDPSGVFDGFYQRQARRDAHVDRRRRLRRVHRYAARRGRLHALPRGSPRHQSQRSQRPHVGHQLAAQGPAQNRRLLGVHQVAGLRRGRRHPRQDACRGRPGTVRRPRAPAQARLHRAGPLRPRDLGRHLRAAQQVRPRRALRPQLHQRPDLRDGHPHRRGLHRPQRRPRDAPQDLRAQGQRHHLPGDPRRSHGPQAPHRVDDRRRRCPGARRRRRDSRAFRQGRSSPPRPPAGAWGSSSPRRASSPRGPS